VADIVNGNDLKKSLQQALSLDKVIHLFITVIGVIFATWFFLNDHFFTVAEAQQWMSKSECRDLAQNLAIDEGRLGEATDTESRYYTIQSTRPLTDPEKLHMREVEQRIRRLEVRIQSWEQQQTKQNCF
jgi:hypothetical protein